MYSVIRDGVYLETDTLLFGDLKVPKKPHEYAIFLNGEWVLDTDTYFQSLDKSEAYKEEKDLGITTTLSEGEYLDLIAKRQERRAILNDLTI